MALAMVPMFYLIHQGNRWYLISKNSGWLILIYGTCPPVTVERIASARVRKCLFQYGAKMVFPIGYHNRMNNRIPRNHPNIWRFIQFMQKEEKRFETVLAHWSTGAAKKKNVSATGEENRINALHERYQGGLINATDLLTSFSHHVGSATKKLSNMDDWPFSMNSDSIRSFTMNLQTKVSSAEVDFYKWNKAIKSFIWVLNESKCVRCSIFQFFFVRQRFHSMRLTVGLPHFDIFVDRHDHLLIFFFSRKSKWILFSGMPSEFSPFSFEAQVLLRTRSNEWVSICIDTLTKRVSIQCLKHIDELS